MWWCLYKHRYNVGYCTQLKTEWITAKSAENHLCHIQSTRMQCSWHDETETLFWCLPGLGLCWIVHLKYVWNLTHGGENTRNYGATRSVRDILNLIIWPRRRSVRSRYSFPLLLVYALCALSVRILFLCFQEHSYYLYTLNLFIFLMICNAYDSNFSTFKELCAFAAIYRVLFDVIPLFGQLIIFLEYIERIFLLNPICFNNSMPNPFSSERWKTKIWYFWKRAVGLDECGLAKHTLTHRISKNYSNSMAILQIKFHFTCGIFWAIQKLHR